MSTEMWNQLTEHHASKQQIDIIEPIASNIQHVNILASNMSIERWNQLTEHYASKQQIKLIEPTASII